MSPLISITRAPSESSRTSNVVAASGMVLFLLDGHEIRQPRDLEDLAVVVRQAGGPYLHVSCARLREQADDQRDARAVDVLDLREVERYGARIAARGLAVGALERSLGRGVHVSVERQHRRPAPLLQGHLELTRRHRRL